MSTVKVCLLSVAMIEIMKKKKTVGEERVCFVLQLTVHQDGKSMQEQKVRIWEHEQKQRPRKNGAYYFLSMACRESCLLSCISQHHLPRSSTSHSELKHPTSFTDQENTCRLAYSPIWGMRFLSWGSLFSDDLSLCLAKQATCTPTWPVCLSPWKPLVHSLILWIQLYEIFLINEVMTYMIICECLHLLNHFLSFLLVVYLSECD